MQKKFIIISLAMIFTFLAGDVFSQQRHMGRRDGWRNMRTPGHGHMRGMCFGDDEYMRERLDLNDEQIAAISNINKKFGDRLFALRDKLRPFRQRLQTLLLSKNIELSKVRAVLKEISDIEIEVRMTKIEHRLAIENVFTPEQRKILNEEKRGMRHRNRWDD